MRKHLLETGAKLMTNLGRVGVAVVILALAALGSACSGSSNHHVVIVM
jgi:hypothetical protein